MIRSVEIKSFRGIREGRLDDFTPLVVLVGPNGAGKSTILDALLIGASPNPGQAIGEVVKRHQGVVGGGPWLFWDPAHNKASEVSVTTYGQVVRCCMLELETMSTNPAASKVSCIVREGQNGLGDVMRLHTGFAPDNTYSTPDRTRALAEVPNLRLLEGRGGPLERPLHQVYTRARQLHGREAANSVITDVIPGGTDVEILTHGDSPIVYLALEGRSIPVALTGDGTYAALRLSLELISEGPGVVLIEEPEVHQHPRAMRQTARAILAAVRRNIQVILTTHSLELIDSLVGEFRDEEEFEKLSLYRVELEDGLLKSCRHPGPEVAFARRTIEDDLR